MLVIASSCQKGRVQTGFPIKGLKGIITALHGVVDARDIRVFGESGELPISGEMNIDKVDSITYLTMSGAQARTLSPTTSRTGAPVCPQGSDRLLRVVAARSLL
jgi:hypothetical protein